MKKLLSLVALSTLLVACSQDELAPLNETVSVDLGNRPTIGQVSFDLGPQTRIALDGSFSWAWENGDKIGACIIDAPIAVNVTGYIGTNSALWTYADYVNNVKKIVGTKNVLVTETFTALNGDVKVTAENFYTVADYVSTNYPYESQNKVFTSQANLVEGNYMFYAPFSATHLTREPIQVVTPMKQDCSDAVMKDTKYLTKDAKVSSTSLNDFYKGVTEGFENIPVAVGYQFLGAPADRSVIIKPSLAMHNLFAYPMITITNKLRGYLFDAERTSTSMLEAPKMVLDSIQIYTTSTNVELNYKQTIDNKKLNANLNEGGEWVKNRYIGSSTSDILAAPDVYKVDNYFPVSDATTTIKFATTGASASYKQQHITCNLGGKELAQGTSYHFHAILPAENYAQELFAKIFVKINGVRYTILNGTVTVTEAAGGKASVADDVNLSDWNFIDKINGSQDARFVFGEHYPAPELHENGIGTKSFAGTMMTINLTGGLNQAAFALKDVKENNSGFIDNADFISYMTNDVQRGVYLKEDTAAAAAPRDTWKTSFPTTGAGTFAFAKNTACIINAELIKVLKNKMYQNDTTGQQMDLKTNLPIAGDVKFTVMGEEYTFTTLDGTATYIIKMPVASVGKAGDALVAGINNIGTSAQTTALSVALAMKPDNSNAIVYLNGASGVLTTATLTSSTGINAIYVNDNTVLNVNTACSSLIIQQGGKINISSGGSLTNANNEFISGGISNTNLRPIAGNVKPGVVISASSPAWPTSVIPASSKINQLTITQIGSLALDQAQVGKLTDLSDVDVVLAASITGITSNANVTLTNIKRMTSEAAADISWTKGGMVEVTVTHKTINPFFTKIIAGLGVSFAEN